MSHTHHLDRRAGKLASESDGNDDDLLDTRAVATWLGVSEQWLEVGRRTGYGPRFLRLSVRMVRYKRSDVTAWLQRRARRNAGAGK